MNKVSNIGGAIETSNSSNGEKTYSNQILNALITPFYSRLEAVLLKDEDFIYQSGDKIKEVYFPESAVISEYQMLEDGRTSEVAMIGKEGITGLEVVLNSGTATHWLRVSVGGRALKLGSEIFKREFDDNADFREVVLNYLHHYLEQTSQKVICNCYHSIEKRLCSWLLGLYERSGKDNVFVTHEQLAHVLGVQRPSITRITQNLREKKVIDYERGNISILDRAKLEDTACSCCLMIDGIQ